MSPAVAIKNGGVPVIRRQNERLLGRRRPARGGRLYGRYVAQRIASFILNKSAGTARLLACAQTLRNRAACAVGRTVGGLLIED